jgi:hypothetical protein
LDYFTVHYTPKHGSWLNHAEIEISLCSRQWLGKRCISSLNDYRLKVAMRLKPTESLRVWHLATQTFVAFFRKPTFSLLLSASIPQNGRWKLSA